MNFECIGEVYVDNIQRKTTPNIIFTAFYFEVQTFVFTISDKILAQLFISILNTKHMISN